MCGFLDTGNLSHHHTIITPKKNEL